MKHILNLADVPLERLAHGEKFDVLDGPVGPHVGAQKLGYSLCIVPAGKRAFPFHNHHVNEEMFLVLEGSGVVRIGDAEHPIRAGDVIASPAGGRALAHQIVNTSQAELRYLCVSTMIDTDVIEYPDSDKVAVYVGGAPGTDGQARSFDHRGRLGPRLLYFDGED